MIGPHWLTVADAAGTRRLDSPHDFVRLEIGKALQRGIRVIPVLVGGGAIPRVEDLPADLQALCERQAVEVRDAHFHSDAEQLIEILHKAIHGVGFRPANFSRRRWLLVLAPIATVSIIILGILLMRPHPQPGATVTGKWHATVKYDWGDSYREVFEFAVDANDISGSASFLGTARGILDGKVAGNRIRFSTKSSSAMGSDEKTYQDKHDYTGIVENDAIQFTMTTDSPTESHVPVHFVATKVNAN